MSDFEHVRVGVSVIVRRGSSVLMGKRKGSHGAGKWALPGGHLEKGETVQACAARELEEETGFQAVPSAFEEQGFTNDIFEQEGKHYVTLFVEVEYEELEGKLTICEPDKCEEWAWTRSSPGDLFLPVYNLIKKGYRLWRPS